jgi:hypothetical protein
MIVDLFLVYQFIKRLATPFKEWDAYELGIIDDKGNQLKKRREFSKQAEHRAFGLFDVVTVKLKRMLEKVPGGKTRLGSYAAALWLIKEHKTIEKYGEDYIWLEEDVIKEVKQNMILAEDYVGLDDLFERAMDEDAPANNVGGGAIAGTGGAGGEPGLTPAQMKKYKKDKEQPLKRFKEFK